MRCKNLEEVAANGGTNASAKRAKRIFDLQVQNSQPFEYEQRLAELSQRQNEIEEALDLTKGTGFRPIGFCGSGGHFGNAEPVACN